MSEEIPIGVIGFWYKALKYEIGIAIATDNKSWLEKELYEARQHDPNPELQKLIMMRPAEPKNEIWLVRKAIEMDEEGYVPNKVKPNDAG